MNRSTPISIGDLVWLPTPLRDHPENVHPGLRDQALAFEAEVTAEPGRVVSIEDGWAMVDRGSWGQFGHPVTDLRLAEVIDKDRPCPHLDFAANVAVNRIGEAETVDGLPRAYMADITVSCADCGEPFRWTGLRTGASFDQPMVSPDERELRAPLRPASADPDFGMGIPGFAIAVREVSGE